MATSQTAFITKGSTNVTVDIDLIQDNSGTNPGDPLTGLLFNSTGLVCWYRRGGTGTLTQLTLATQTVGGAHADGGFIEISSANAPGAYRLDLSDAIVASGVDSAKVWISGFADLTPHVINIVLTDVDLYDGTSAGISRIDADITSRLAPTIAGRTLDVTAAGTAGIDWGNVENVTTTINFTNTTIGTVTANTDMRGTDNAFLAANAPANFSDLLITATTGLVDITQAGADKVWSSVARTLSSAANITSDASAITMSAAGVVGTVNVVNTTTTNTDMRGTDNALLAASYIAPDNAGIAANGVAIGNLNDISVTDILTTQMTESYAADGVAPTLAQSLFNIQQNIGEFSISGTTITVRQIDGITTAMTYTLDDATNPTSRTRTT